MAHTPCISGYSRYGSYSSRITTRFVMMSPTGLTGMRRSNSRMSPSARVRYSVLGYVAVESWEVASPSCCARHAKPLMIPKMYRRTIGATVLRA